DSLDLDKNGYLTLGEFSSGFSMFIISFQKGEHFKNDLLFGTIFLSSGDEQLSENEDDEERHVCMLMESLGASNVFEDEVRSLWAQLRKDEPHLLSNFEEFLARVTYQIKEARQERKEMETHLAVNCNYCHMNQQLSLDQTIPSTLLFKSDHPALIKHLYSILFVYIVVHIYEFSFSFCLHNIFY
uniref:EF-hand domain-containing protein n=1 Tax=Sinocyclocheilus grahami TaxID=75366 RepID=A0A672JR35_SINGR